MRPETVEQLRDVLIRNGFVECDIRACNCGSWHHRYGLPERMAEIKHELSDAGVLNNDTGNLPINALKKLRDQRDHFERRLADALRAVALYRESHNVCIEGTSQGRCHKCRIADAIIAEAKERT